MANLQQIANCLMKTLEGNTATIKQAELYLERASRQDSFITILLSIPQMDGVSSQLARIATIYTLTYARNIVLWKSQALINKTAQLFLQFLANPAINFNYKDQISAALQYLIEKDQSNIIVSAFISNMIDTLKKNNQTPVTQINFEFIVAVSEALSDKIVPAVGGRVQEYVRESIAGLSYLGVKVVELGTQYKGTDNSFLERALILITKILKILKKYLRKFLFFQPSTSLILQHPNFLQLIKSVFTLNLPQNPQNIPLFYFPSTTSTLSGKLVQYFHTIKSLIIFIITQSLRVILSNYKIFNVDSFQQIKIAAMGHQFIGAFVQAVEKMLQKMPYFKIKSRAVFKIVGEVYDFLTAALRSGKYYTILNSTKQTVIYSCILKTLAFTPQDYSNYYHNPQQFTYSLFHILDIDANLLLNKDTPSAQDQNISIVIFDTLKTHGANLLKAYCKYIDGTVAEIFNFAINVIDDKLNVEISKNLMYVVLGVLREQASNRDDLLEEVERIVFRDLADLQIPTKRVEEPYNIQYTLNLLVLHRYLLILDKQHQKLKKTHLKYSVIERSFILTQTLLKQPRLEQTPKLIASQLLYSILSTEQSQMYSRRTIEILNGIISAQHINGKYLQCVQQIIKFNAQPFVQDYAVLVDLVQRVAGLLIGEIKKKDKGEGNQEVVDKLWHILEAFVESQELGVAMADTLRRVLQPLINMIDGQNQLQLEQKVYKMLVTIIQKTAQVSQYQLQILSILPKTFYTGKKKRSLSTSFPLLHLLLMYGKQHLKQVTILKNLILLCIENINSKTVNQIPRPETQCLEGVLILQSLIISVGGVLTPQMWVVIAKTIVQKIKDMFVYLFVKAEVLALLMLVLVGGCACFGVADCQEMLKIIITNYECLNYYHPCKLFILSCCSLLQQPSLPFLHPHLPHIFDLTITLLKLSTQLSTQSQSLRKDSEQIELDGQQKQYKILICFSITPYSKVDEYEWFKGTINVLKQQNEVILNALYQQLPEVKKKYLSELLNIRRVGDNARVIFKVRNNNKSAM